jgi:hypothetical protein
MDRLEKNSENQASSAGRTVKQTPEPGSVSSLPMLKSQGPLGEENQPLWMSLAASYSRTILLLEGVQG